MAGIERAPPTERIAEDIAELGLVGGLMLASLLAAASGMTIAVCRLIPSGLGGCWWIEIKMLVDSIEAIAVVALATLRVAQHIERSRDALEFRLGFGVIRVVIWVAFVSRPSKRTFDALIVGRRLHAEYVVQVSGHASTP
jgi:hypothetical protein